MNKPFRCGAPGRAAIGAVAALALFSLPGCADMAGLGGTSQFACKAPAGVQCNSVSGNYANSLQNNLPFQRAGRAQREQGAVAATLAVPPMPAPAAVTEGLAARQLRSRGRELRLWIKAWEDQEHDLNDQSFVYMQLDPGRWLVDHVQAKAREPYAPLRAAPAADQAAPAGAGMAVEPQAEERAGPVPDGTASTQ